MYSASALTCRPRATPCQKRPSDADRDACVGVARRLDETDRRENVLYPSVGYVGIAFDLEDVGQRSSLRTLLDGQSRQELLADVLGNLLVRADPAVEQICRLECGFDSRGHVWFDGIGEAHQLP